MEAAARAGRRHHRQRRRLRRWATRARKPTTS